MPEKKSEGRKEGTSKAIAVNVNKVIKKRNGEPLRQQIEEKDFEFCAECEKKVLDAKGAEVTVRSVIVDALDSMPRPQPGQRDDKKLSGSDKLKRGLLAKRIYETVGKIELQVDDLSLIKKLVGEMQTPLVVSQVLPEIDPKTEEVE